MKIGIDATFLNEKPTGVGVFTKEISERLSKLHRETLIFTSVPMNAPVRATPLTLRGSTRRADNVLRFIYTNTILPVAARKAGVDVLFCPITEFPFVPQTSLVVTVHDFHQLHFREQFGLASRHFAFSMRLLRTIATRVLVPSQFVKRELLARARLDAGSVDVVPEGYDSLLFKPRDASGCGAFFSRWGLGHPYILCVGSLFPYKNVETLVRSFEAVRHLIPHDLLIIGRKDVARRSLPGGDRVRYLGYIDSEELPYFYSYTDLFVHPSLMEGFGITVLEAMACGAPVLSSSGGSLPEVVGQAGMFFDPLDGEALSRAIVEVLSSPSLRQELREKGFMQARKFSWDRAAADVLASCETAARTGR